MYFKEIYLNFVQYIENIIKYFFDVIKNNILLSNISNTSIEIK